jgi:hypothetical protein
VPYAPIGFKFCLDIKNNRALPLDLVCLEYLNVYSLVSLPYVIATQFVTKKETRGFKPICLVFEFHVTNYIKKIPLLCFHTKIHMPFWDELKKA